MLHGDAHGGNLLPAAGSWLWADLEETCRGPREWDLMVLARSAASARGTSASEVALTAYAAVTGTPLPAPETLIPLLALVSLRQRCGRWAWLTSTRAATAASRRSCWHGSWRRRRNGVIPRANAADGVTGRQIR